MSDSVVKLLCVKEGGRLRVKIASPGYAPKANCQFPKCLRREGRVFSVPSSWIRLERRGTNAAFYSVRASADALNNLATDSLDELDLTNLRLFEASADCIICMNDQPSTQVVFPCGHLYLCADCATKTMSRQEKRCAICREPILGMIDKSQII